MLKSILVLALFAQIPLQPSPPIITDARTPIETVDFASVERIEPVELQFEAMRASSSKAVSVPTGSHSDWLRAAGVAESDWKYVDYIATKESRWRNTAQNPTSTAYGIFQFLDSTWKGVGCVKTSDPIEQIKCADKYAARYGGWAGSYAKWLRSNWW